MKNIFILFFLVFNYSFGQDSYQAKEMISYEQVLEKNATNEIYALDIQELDSLIKYSDKKYHLIYTFASWCKPCLKTMPKVLEMVKDEKNIELYVLNIETNEEKLKETKEVLEKRFHYNKNSFMISDEYGDSRWKKYENFVERIVPGHKEYGLSLFILMDKNGEVLYASTYNESKKLRLHKIKDLTRSPNSKKAAL